MLDLEHCVYVCMELSAVFAATLWYAAYTGVFFNIMAAINEPHRF
jgi:hypothetical protein